MFLFLITFMFCDIISAQTCPDVTRTLTNAKSTNANKWDDIGAVMSNLLTGPSDASWLFETGAIFQENGDGTAKISGTLKLFGDATPARRFDVVLNLTGRTYVTPAGGAYNNTGVPITTWYYYPNFTGTLTGKDALAGSQLSVSLFMHALQVGIGADQIFDSPEDRIANGGAAWFSWKILSQPTDTSIVLHDYIQGYSEADFAFLLSGTPTAPCNPINNICGASAGTVALTATTVTLQNSAAVIQGQPTADSKSPSGFFTTYVITKGDSLTIIGANPTNYFTVNSTGTYRVHVLIFDPNTLNLSKIQFGTTTASQISALLTQEGGTVCGSFNLTGSKITVNSGILPIANNDTATTAQNTPVTISELTNDTINGTLQSVTIKSQLLNGTVTLNAANQFVYTPNAGFSGTDIFTYFITNQDGSSNTATVTVTITSTCIISFVTSSKPEDISVQADCGKTSATVTWIAPIATSNCGNPIVKSNHNPGDLFPIGTTTVTYTATLNGLSVTCSFKVTVTGDTQAPVITCPSSMTKTGIPNATNCWTSCTWADATATDNCSATVTQISGPKSGSCIGYGVSTITYKAIDAAGNFATCSFTVTITKPVCGEDMKIAGYSFLGSCNGSDYYRWTNSGDPNFATANDICVKIGGRLPIIKSKGQNDFISSKLGTANCWLGLQRKSQGSKEWYCSDNSTASWFNWASGEPNNSGSLENTVQMSSNGTWNDVSCSTTNWCIVEIACGGNSNPCANDVTPPSIVCPANMTKTPTNNLKCWTSFTWSDATATDNCCTPIVTQIAGPKSASCIGYGVSTITYKATDAKGNAATCSFTITVNKQTTEIDQTKCYKIVNKHSGKCLETRNGSYKTPTPCIQDDYKGSDYQKWSFTDAGNGCYKIKNVQSGKYFACNNNWNGAQLCQNNYDNNSGQCDWQVIKNNDGSCTYKNRSCGKVADVSGASKDNGASCVAFDNFNTDNQEWIIEEVAPPKTSGSCGWGCWDAQSSKVFEANASAEASRNRVDFTNNLGFQVNYFAVQKLNPVTSEFEKLELLNNKVSDNSLQSYTVYDTHPTEGDNTYRVEMTNLDGQKSASELLIVNFSKILGANVYPNPAVDYIEVDMREFAGSNVTMTLYNQIGVQILSRSIDKTNADTTEHFDLSVLGNGQYFLRLTAKDKRAITKVITIMK